MVSNLQVILAIQAIWKGNHTTPGLGDGHDYHGSLTAYKSWDDPPSKDHIIPKRTQHIPGFLRGKKPRKNWVLICEETTLYQKSAKVVGVDESTLGVGFGSGARMRAG